MRGRCVSGRSQTSPLVISGKGFLTGNAHNPFFRPALRAGCLSYQLSGAGQPRDFSTGRLEIGGVPFPAYIIPDGAVAPRKEKIVAKNIFPGVWEKTIGRLFRITIFGTSGITNIW